MVHGFQQFFQINATATLNQESHDASISAQAEFSYSTQATLLLRQPSASMNSLHPQN
jgi:hypothetical protein